jgi:hypothetical protein
MPLLIARGIRVSDLARAQAANDLALAKMKSKITWNLRIFCR